MDIYFADVAGPLVAIIDTLAVGNGCDLASKERIGCGRIISGLRC